MWVSTPDGRLIDITRIPSMPVITEHHKEVPIHQHDQVLLEIFVVNQSKSYLPILCTDHMLEVMINLCFTVCLVPYQQVLELWLQEKGLLSPGAHLFMQYMLLPVFLESSVLLN